MGAPGGAGDTRGSWGHPGELPPSGSLCPPASLGDPSAGPCLGTVPAGAPSPVPRRGRCPCQHDSHQNRENARRTQGWKQVPGLGGPGGGRGTSPHPSRLPHRCGAQPEANTAQVGLGVPRATAEGPPMTPPHPQAALFLSQSLPPPLPALRVAALPTQHRGAGSQGVLLGGPGRGGTGASPFKGGGCHAESPFLCWRAGQAPRGDNTGRGTARRGEGSSQPQTEPRQLSARGADRVRRHG